MDSCKDGRLLLRESGFCVCRLDPALTLSFSLPLFSSLLASLFHSRLLVLIPIVQRLVEYCRRVTRGDLLYSSGPTYYRLQSADILHLELERFQKQYRKKLQEGGRPYNPDQITSSPIFVAGENLMETLYTSVLIPYLAEFGTKDNEANEIMQRMPGGEDLAKVLLHQYHLQL